MNQKQPQLTPVKNKDKRILTIFRSLIGVVLLVVIVGCSRETSTQPLQPKDKQAQEETPEAFSTSIEYDLSRDSPRPAVISPMPPTWTPEPKPQPTHPPAAPSAVFSDPTAEPLYYIVELGDTLGEIADRFDVAIADLVAANDLEDIDHIEEGQSLLIP